MSLITPHGRRLQRRWILLGFAVLVAGYAVYQLIESVGQAGSTGLVRVTTTHRGAVPQSVPWPHAWAYLLGQALVAGGGAVVAACELWRGRTPWRAGVVMALGFVLVLLSGILANLAGTAVLMGSLLAIFAASMVAERLGRTAGLWFWAALVAASFCWVVR